MIMVLLLILPSSARKLKDELEDLPDARQLQTTEIIGFTTIEKGSYSNIKVIVADVFRSELRFCRFWSRHSLSECPTVDFDTNMVVALFRGTKKTGGYGIEVTSIEETDSEIIVQANSTDPPPNSFTPQALTQPYHIVSTETSTKNVVFDVVKVREPRPFPVFIVRIEDGYELKDIREEVEALASVENVNTLQSIGMLLVYFDENKISAQKASDLLSGISGTIVEADPPIINEDDNQEDEAATEDPDFSESHEWLGMSKGEVGFGVFNVL